MGIQQHPHTNIHTHRQTYSHTPHTLMHTSTCRYIHTYTHTHTHTHTHMHAYTHTRTHMHTHTHTHTHTYTHTYMHAHIQTHRHLSTDTCNIHLMTLSGAARSPNIGVKGEKTEMPISCIRVTGSCSSWHTLTNRIWKWFQVKFNMTTPGQHSS